MTASELFDIDAVDLAEDLAEQMAAEPGAAVRVPFGKEDVGSELIAILSEGLYPDPRDALREYTQNALDANSSDVWIEFEGRTIAVRDVGTGMDLSALLEARKVAKSPKTGGGFVGFRGIGIYAAVNLCERLRIQTVTAHSDTQYTMTFDFFRMRQTLQRHRGQPGSKQASLAAMLEECTSLREDQVDPSDHGSTCVSLQEINAAAYRELQDVKALEDYLVNVLPIAYDPASPYSAKIDTHLATLVPGYRTVNVHLVDRLQETTRQIYRRFPEGISEPIFLNAMVRDRFEAVIWACLSNRERLPNGGLLYRLHGFTVGDRFKARALFKKREQTYTWYFGEIYVLDDAVRPNAARNDFELGEAKRRLEDALEPCLADLGKRADHYWVTLRANEELAAIEPLVHELGRKIAIDAKKYLYVPQHYAEIQYLRLRTKKQRLPRTPTFEPLRTKQERLLRALDDLQSTLPIESTNDHAQKSAKPHRSSGSETSRARVKVEPGSETTDLVTLFLSAGVRLSSPQKRVLQVVQRAIEETLVVGSSDRREFEIAVARHIHRVN